jgi:hypothetical protein
VAVAGDTFRPITILDIFLWAELCPLLSASH